MTNEELKDKLLQIMNDEFEEYEDNLLQEDPREMLQMAYGYLVRQDILYAIDDMILSDKEYKALLSEQHPLEQIYNRWMDVETHYMDNIRDNIRCHVNEVLRDEFLKSRRDAR